jgi:tRNA threonylcarbamoyladenosine biosynthesis protein TsaB
MLLLVADTSGKQGSIALATVRNASTDLDRHERGTRAGAAQGKVEILETVPLTGGAFSAELIPQVAALISRQGKMKNDLDAFVVVSGPGSFTGLRVGLVAIKGLAEALQKPIVAISLLEAIATSAETPGRTLAVLDAGRGDVYAGDYSVESNVPTAMGQNALCHSERLLTLEEFLREANSEPRKRVITPEAVLGARLQTTNLDHQLVPYPSSTILAMLGWQRLQRGETISSEALEANYIRRSDAEIFAKPADGGRALDKKGEKQMPPPIRSATASDLDAIIALEQGVANAAHWSRHQYERLLANGLILVAGESAGENSTLAGFLCCRNTAAECEIENIAIATEWVRRGIGTALLRNLIDRARAEQAPRILLEVRESNLAARKLYEKNGFSETGRRRSYYQHPTEDAVLYELSLDPRHTPQ